MHRPLQLALRGTLNVESIKLLLEAGTNFQAGCLSLAMESTYRTRPEEDVLTVVKMLVEAGADINDFDTLVLPKLNECKRLFSFEDIVRNIDNARSQDIVLCDIREMSKDEWKLMPGYSESLYDKLMSESVDNDSLVFSLGEAKNLQSLIMGMYTYAKLSEGESYEGSSVSLSKAICMSYPSVASYLVEQGADWEAKDSHEKNSLDYARSVSKKMEEAILQGIEARKSQLAPSL